MCIFNLITRVIAPIPKIENEQSFLFVAPHPDDIEIGIGGTVDKLVRLGKKVTFLIATDGRYGTQSPDITPDELVDIRKNEALESAKILGVFDVRFLNFPDGGHYDLLAMTDEIAKEICRLQPDVVFAPDYTVASEQHLDHLNVGKASANAFVMCGAYHIAKEWGLNCASPKAMAFYYTDKPNRFIKIRSYSQAVIPALRKHKSQFTHESGKSIEMYLKFRSVRMGIRRLTPFAEGVRALGAIHVHCCPEVNWLK